MAEAAVPEVVRLTLTELPGYCRLGQCSLPLAKSATKSRREAYGTPSLHISPHSAVQLAVGRAYSFAIVMGFEASVFLFVCLFEAILLGGFLQALF